MDPLGHVLEQVGQAPLRIRVGQHAQGPPIGEVPPGLLGLRGPVGGEHPGLPAAEIRLLGQFPGVAQGVEDLAVEGTALQEGGVEVPELAIGGVVEDELLARVEHRDGGGQLVEGADVGVHLALQVGADALQFRDVDGDADGPGLGRHLGDVEGAARARHHGRDPQRPRPAPGPAALRLLAGGAFQKFGPLAHRTGAVARFRCGSVGGIGPGQAPVAAAAPDRLRDRVEEAGQRVEPVAGLLQGGAQRDEFPALAGEFAQAQERLAADRLPLRLDGAALERVDGAAEALAAPAQGLDRGVEGGGVGGHEPGPEGQHPADRARPGPFRGDADIALDQGLAAGIPGHDDLRLGTEQQVGPVVGAAQLGELGVQGVLAPGPAGALAQVEQRQDGGEDRQADQHREAHGVVRVQARSGLRRLGGGREAECAAQDAGTRAAAEPSRRTSKPHDPSVSTRTGAPALDRTGTPDNLNATPR